MSHTGVSVGVGSHGVRKVVTRMSAQQLRWSVASLLEHYTHFAQLAAHHVGDRAPLTDDHLHATAETLRARAQGLRRNIDGQLVPPEQVWKNVAQPPVNVAFDDDDSDTEQGDSDESDSEDEETAPRRSPSPSATPGVGEGGVAAERPWCHCCLLAFGSEYSVAWSAFQSGGVASMLALLHSRFQWGSGRAASLCTAATLRNRLDCGGMAAFFIHLAREVKRAALAQELAQPDRLASSLPPFPFSVVGVCLIMTCSAEERRRWMQAARRAGGDVAWIGPAASESSHAVCYHQCMGLVRNDDGALWVWDDGKFLLPPQPNVDVLTQHKSIVALKITEREVPVLYSPAAGQQAALSVGSPSSATSPSPVTATAGAAVATPFQFPDSPLTGAQAPVTQARWGEYVIHADHWYSFLTPEYAIQAGDDLAALPSIINMPTTQALVALAPAPAVAPLAAHAAQPLVFISGLAMNDDNPAPGSGIARAIRAGTQPRAVGQGRNLGTNVSATVGNAAAPYGVHVVGVDYSAGSAGMECEAIDEALVVDSWEAVTARDHARDVLRRLAADPLAFWIPASDCETALLAKGLHQLRADRDKHASISHSSSLTDLAGAANTADCGGLASPSVPNPAARDWSQASSRVLIPPFSALELTAKPCLEVAKILGMDVPPTLLIDRASKTGAALSLHSLLAFTASQRGPYWIKGELFGAAMATHYTAAAATVAGMQSAIDQQVIIQLGVSGLGRGVAFAAVEGVLTGAVGFTKSQSTALLKGWSGVLESVDADLLSRIEDLCRAMNYTGGGELEFVEGLDGRRAFIDFNARFPAWISASALANINLPAALLQHAMHEYSKQALASSSTTNSPFVAEVAFPTSVLEQTRRSGHRVHFTRTIVETVSTHQPAVLYGGFDSGMAGGQQAHPHPARLIDMAKVYSQDDDDSAPAAGKKDVTSTPSKKDAKDDVEAVEKEKERAQLKKSEKRDKVGSGVDKYLPLIAQAWFDGSISASQTQPGANADAIDVRTLLSELPLASDMDVNLSSKRAELIQRLREPQTPLTNLKPTSLVTQSLKEKLWVVPRVHIDMPDVLHSLSLLAPKASALQHLPTPCFVVSTSLVQRAVRAFQEVLNAAAARANITGGAIIGMSVKTQPLQQVLQSGLPLGAYAECISLGEVRAALDAGYTPEHIMFNGPGKNVDRTSEQQGEAGRLLLASHADAHKLKAFERALGNRTSADVFGAHAATRVPRLASINADSVQELKYIVDAILDPTHYIKSNSVGIRLTPPLNPSRFGSTGASHYVALAAEGSLNAGSVVHTLVGVARQLLRLPEDITFGIHFHFASSTLGWAQWIAALHGTVTQAALLDQLLQSIGAHEDGTRVARSHASRRLAYFDLGGGFPAGLILQPHVRQQMADMVCFIKAQLPGVNCVYLEPGKSLSERAGALLTTVQHTRELALHGEAANYARYDVARFDKEARKRAKKGTAAPRPGAPGFQPLSQAALRVGAARPAEIAVVDACVCDLGSVPTHAHPLLYLQASRVDAARSAQVTPAAAATATAVSVAHPQEGEQDLPEWAASGALPTLGEWNVFPTGPSALYGRICMEWDVLGLGLRFPSEGLVPGDKILLGHAGAYDMSMAYEFGRGKEAKVKHVQQQTTSALVKDVPVNTDDKPQQTETDVAVYFMS